MNTKEERGIPGTGLARAMLLVMFFYGIAITAYIFWTAPQ